MFAGIFAPRGWALCDGQLLSISQNTALFSLLGTTYGGDGRTTFALPDMRGRIPLHQGQGPGLSERTLGEKSGEENVSLTVGEIPRHSHGAWAHAFDGLEDKPEGQVFARNVAGLPMYANFDRSGLYVQLHPETGATTGGSLPHNNMQPFQAVHFIIALMGIFPSRT